MKIALYNNEKFLRFGYPGKYIDKPIEGLNDGLQFYFIEEIKPEITNLDKYYLSEKDVILTEEKHPDYDHFLKAVQEYELVEYSKDIIIDKLNAAVGDWIESCLPVWKQVKYISRFMYLDLLKNEGTVTDEQLLEMSYLNDVDNWVIKCRADRDLREEEYINNGIFPSFIFDEMPIKNY